MAQKIIEVADLKKYYNGGAVHAMDGVTVDICRGDVIAVIGPSGGGKSTFLHFTSGAICMFHIKHVEKCKHIRIIQIHLDYALFIRLP